MGVQRGRRISVRRITGDREEFSHCRRTKLIPSALQQPGNFPSIPVPTTTATQTLIASAQYAQGIQTIIQRSPRKRTALINANRLNEIAISADALPHDEASPIQRTPPALVGH